jgi:hypothetical protein
MMNLPVQWAITVVVVTLTPSLVGAQASMPVDDQGRYCVVALGPTKHGSGTQLFHYQRFQNRCNRAVLLEFEWKYDGQTRRQVIAPGERLQVSCRAVDGCDGDIYYGASWAQTDEISRRDLDRSPCLQVTPLSILSGDVAGMRPEPL